MRMAMAESIVALTHEFFPQRGGIAVYLQEVLMAAQTAGHDVEVWAPACPTVPPGPGLTIHRMPVKGRQDWVDRWRLIRHLRRERPDWSQSLLLLGEPGPMRTWLYARGWGAPVPKRLTLLLHGSEILRMAAHPARAWLFQRLLDRADRVGVVSRYTQSLLDRRFRVSADKLRLAYGAVPSGLNAALRHISREDPGLRPGRPGLRQLVILTVARLHPRKGQRTVIEALGGLAAELRDRVSYVAVGPVVRPAYAAQLQSTARQAGVDLHLPGPVSEQTLVEWMAAADLFAMASEQHGSSVEGFGLACLEAAAAGLPVIGVRAGGLPEAIADGRNGLLVEPGRIESLRETLRRLLTETGLRMEMGRAGRQWAARFSWSEAACNLGMGS